MSQPLILVLNCGSSSIKFAVIDPTTENIALHGLAEEIGSPEARIAYALQGQDKVKDFLTDNTYSNALNTIFSVVLDQEDIKDKLIGVGHRVVHGGESFISSSIVNAETLADIQACIPLAPLHNPANLLGIKLAREVLPNLPQIAVFDTAFHQTMPEYAYLYPLPYDLYRLEKIRRYGFHGTSHRFVSEKAAEIFGRQDINIVTAHLGNGCSVAAIKSGKSIDTSMGFTPLEGLMMGTRCGDIDPSIPTYLIEHLKLTPVEVDTLLNKKSGLLGVSESSNDMRLLVSRAQDGSKQAAVAIEMFCYRLAKYIASLSVPLGEIHGLIFTGGIGENSALIREKVIDWLSALDFKIDLQNNANHGADFFGLITTVGSCPAYVIPTNEEGMIAKDAYYLITTSE